MSFKHKVLITNIVLMAVCLGVVGFLMIHNSYQVSMDMQLDRAMEEHQMIVSAVESAVVDLLVNDSFYSMEQIGEIGSEIAVSVEGTGAKFSFLDGERNCIYINMERLDFDGELLNYLERGRRNYIIEEQDGNETLTIASLIRVNDSNMYLVNQRDVSDLYKQNEKQIWFFQITMLIALVVCASIISIISHWLTRPIEQLNNTASVIASGDYSVRTELVSNDEIGELAEKFDSMAEAIEGHVQELKDHVRQQEDFVASFTHEIKTPMTAIIGYADMLRSKELEKEQQFLAANYIFHEGKRLESMSFKLFDLIALKRQDILPQDIYMPIFGEEIQESVLPVLERAAITFSMKLEAAIVEGDRDLLKTVIINLIDNARKASKAGDEIRMLGACLEETEDTRFYEIQIQDDGCGIPEEEVNKICEAFYMVDKSRAREQGGAGLGLATASLIMEVHHGKLLIKSIVGKGTTICVRLPGREVKEDEAQIET